MTKGDPLNRPGEIYRCLNMNKGDLSLARARARAGARAVLTLTWGR